MKGQVIKLEDGTKYAIAEILMLNNINYIYIINIDNNKDIRFAEIEDDKINFVNDNNLYNLLMLEVFKKQNETELY